MNSLGLLITTFNASETVDRVIELINKNIALLDEVVIVDDCSSDFSDQKLRSALSDLKNVRFFSTTNNSGRPSEPRNLGLKEITTSRVVFLDCDDWIPSAYFSFLRLKTDEGCEQLFSGIKISDQHREAIDKYQPDFTKMRSITAKSESKKNQIVFSGASLPTRIARRVEFLSQPLEDWFFWQELCRTHQLEMLRLTDVPIGYNMNLSLSPRKLQQFQRISRVLNLRSIIRYLFLTLRMKCEESYLTRRVNETS